MSVTVKLLGEARALINHHWAEFPNDNRGALLVYLAYHGTWINRETLAFLFWPDKTDVVARRNLRQLLNRLKPLDFYNCLELDKHQIRWKVTTDVAVLEKAISDKNWQKAVELGQDTLLLNYQIKEKADIRSWLEDLSRRLSENKIDVAKKYAQALKEQENYEAAAMVLQDLLEKEKDNLQEDVLQNYLELVDHTQYREKALTIYKKYCDRLLKDFGLEPLEKTQTLAQALLTIDNQHLVKGVREKYVGKTENGIVVSVLPLQKAQAQETIYTGSQSTVQPTAKAKEPTNYLCTLNGNNPELWDEAQSTVIFKRIQPMLLIAYLKAKGKSTRIDIANHFWPDLGDKHKRLARLSEVLRLIELAVPGTVIKSSDDKFIHTTVRSDVDDLKDAYQAEDFDSIIDIYQGHYLQGLELNKRLKIFDNPELYTWILAQREAIVDITRDALLSYAELKAAQEDFATAETLAQKAYKLQTEQSILLPENYQRIYTLLSAENSADALVFFKEAIEHYGEDAILKFESFQDARSELATPHNLPQVEPLIGRQQELEECSALLLGLNDTQRDVRLVALLGQGGIGKTTLAKELTRRLRGYKLFKDGIYAIWLEDVRDSDEVIEQIARALNLQVPANRLAVDFLSDMISDKAMLLYLDNMEHLLNASSDIDILLERCPNLKILISSREVYPSDWAQLYSLDGLSFPESSPEISSDVETALEFAAVKLFITQGKKVNRNFALDADNVADVIAICQQVHGLALAVKLAASWLRTSTPQVIKQELANGIALLDDVQSHQQSLSASLDLSWNRLSGAEQVAFSKLAVFQAGFTLEAVKEIADLELSVLKDLQQKSLVEWSDVQERYSLHPLLRSYVEAKCNANDLEALKLKHSSYYLKLLRLITDGTQEQRNSAVRVLKPETKNIQSAWQVAVDNLELEELKHTAHAAERLFDELANSYVGIQLLETAIKKLDKESKAHVEAMASLYSSQAWLYQRLGIHDLAIECATNALALNGNHFQTESTAMNVLASSNGSLRNYTEARKYYKKALEFTKNYPGHYASVLSNLASLEMESGNFELAEEHYLESLNIRQKHNQVTRLPANHNFLGQLYLHKKSYDLAINYFNDALESARTLKLDYWITVIYLNKNSLMFEIDKLDDIEAEVQHIKQKAQHKGDMYIHLKASVLLFRMLYSAKKYYEALELLEKSVDLNIQSDEKYIFYRVFFCFMEICHECDMEITNKLNAILRKTNLLSKMNYLEQKMLDNIKTRSTSRKNVDEQLQGKIGQVYSKIERWKEIHLSK